MKLGILLTTSPENENTHTVIALSRAARKLGHKVSIFLMDDGVYNAQKKEFTSLLESGVEIILCTLNTEQRCVGKIEGMVYGSQYDLACIAHESDRLLSFG